MLKKCAFALLLIALIFPLSSCKEVVPGYIVFIDDDGCVAKSIDGKPIETLWVFPGDKVIWINTGSDTKNVKFENSNVFGTLQVTIAAESRVITTVKKGDPGSIAYEITPCTAKAAPKSNITRGTPKAKIPPPPP
jgi:hypothetical protein